MAKFFCAGSIVSNFHANTIIDGITLCFEKEEVILLTMHLTLKIFSCNLFSFPAIDGKRFFCFIF